MMEHQKAPALAGASFTEEFLTPSRSMKKLQKIDETKLSLVSNYKTYRIASSLKLLSRHHWQLRVEHQQHSDSLYYLQPQQVVDLFESQPQPTFERLPYPADIQQ
jgi:hypothetical protein